MRPTERVIERLRISPNVRNENFLTSLAKIFFDSLHKASSDTLTANANVDDEFAKVCPESQVMGAREADNLRPLFHTNASPFAERIASAMVSSDHHGCQNPGTICIRARMFGTSEMIASRSMSLFLIRIPILRP